MNWQAIWFGVNILFIVALITSLFSHRTVTMARLEQAPKEKLDRYKLVRNGLWVVTVILFLAMCGAFLANMHYNG